MGQNRLTFPTILSLLLVTLVSSSFRESNQGRNGLSDVYRTKIPIPCVPATLSVDSVKDPSIKSCDINNATDTNVMDQNSKEETTTTKTTELISIKDFPLRLCSSKLSDMVKMVCKGKYYQGEAGQYGSNRNSTGMASECCLKTCTLRYLESYCA
ncbi:hypothetical protein QAD02_006238 [Eretmocerus hayati]|uniref:Uncharacterized protein n=1 Tax=Eretmocerus hayati TaxID=131215 RepID=A0ACC2N170_9HYME|nr:hypothetical protein QAD02_006238 [Eretmocerus hayati]